MTKQQKSAAKKPQKNKRKIEVTPRFSRRIDYFNLAVLIFAIGSFFGVYYEQFFMLITTYIRTGGAEILWVPRTGLIYGPFSPIYGGGGLLLLLTVCTMRDKKWYQYFIAGAILSGIFEYLMATGQERIFGTRSWDYSEKFLSINGKTTIPIMLLWGFIFIFFIYCVLPFVYKLYRRIPSKVSDILCIVLAVFFVFDITMSIAATYRQNQRRHGVEAQTALDRFCDKHYDDEFLHGVYENAIPVEYLKNR